MGLFNWWFESQESQLMGEAYDAEQAERDGDPLSENLHFVTDAEGNPVYWAPGLHPDPDRVFTADGLVYDGRVDNPGAYERTVQIELEPEQPWWKLW